MMFNMVQDYIRHWKEIQNKMLEDKKYFKKMKHAKWIMKFNFDKVKRKNFKKEIWNEKGKKFTNFFLLFFYVKNIVNFSKK